MLHLVLYGTAAAHTLRPSLTCSPSASPVAVRMTHLRFVPVVAPSAPPQPGRRHRRPASPFRAISMSPFAAPSPCRRSPHRNFTMLRRTLGAAAVGLPRLPRRLPAADPPLAARATPDAPARLQPSPPLPTAHARRRGQGSRELRGQVGRRRDGGSARASMSEVNFLLLF